MPLFAAVDQEGGRVQAWGPPWCEAVPPAAEVGAGGLLVRGMRWLEWDRAAAGGGNAG